MQRIVETARRPRITPWSHPDGGSRAGVRGGLTLGVKQAVGGIFSVVKHLPAQTSGQLPGPGSDAAD